MNHNLLHTKKNYMWLDYGYLDWFNLLGYELALELVVFNPIDWSFYVCMHSCINSIDRNENL